MVGFLRIDRGCHRLRLWRDDTARRLDRYPNFAVDMAARIRTSCSSRGDKLRAFLLKYRDAAIYATDLVVFPRSKTDEMLAEYSNTYARDWKFFSTDQNVEYMGHSYQDLALPLPALRKLFHE